MAAELIKGARKQIGATEQDVINGIKSYLVARSLLEREECDGITMDCLGALGKSEGQPALHRLVEDERRRASRPPARPTWGPWPRHVLVQYLFDRPGFQQDPVAETAREAIIGAHCSCADAAGRPLGAAGAYDIVPPPRRPGRHGAGRFGRWASGSLRADMLPATERRAHPDDHLRRRGLENVSAPPAGGCVVSVMVKFDGVTDVLAYPGFHQLFFYGDFKRELVQFCRLFNIEPVVV